MKQSGLTIFFAALMTALFSACSDFGDMEIPTEELYARAFVKNYGLINPNQTWNMVSRKSVTVSVSGTTPVKVLAQYNGTYAIVANYSSFSGNKEIMFDCPGEVTDLIVIANGISKKSKVGESVSFEGSRSMVDYGNYSSYFSISDDYTELSVDLLKGYSTVVNEEEDNVGKVTCNFSLISQGPFSFYPVYWQSSSCHILGMYWTDTNGYHEQDIYMDKMGDELQICTEESTTWTSVTNTSPSWSSPDKIRAKAITVNLPVGTVFGFYIKVFKDVSHSEFYHKVYSEAENNTVTFNADTDSEHRYASTFTVTKNSETATFFGFEDYGYSVIDLNDIIFMFADKITPGDPPITVDIDNTISWILAAEDLGNADDFDFNDVVVQIENIAGQNPKLTALAAGGTLPVELLFNGTAIASNDGYTAFHSWFVGEPSPYIMINTTSPNTYKSKSAVTLEVDNPDDFTLSDWGTYDTDINDELTGTLKGFSIKVTTANGEVSTITPPGKGNAPQMIMVPSGWAWPTERSRIERAYPGFTSWMNNLDDTEWWRSNYNTSYLVRTPYFGTTSSSGSTTPGTNADAASKVDCTLSGTFTSSWQTVYNVYSLTFKAEYWNNALGIKFPDTINVRLFSDSACTTQISTNTSSVSYFTKAQIEDNMPNPVEGIYTIYLLDYSNSSSISAELY